MPVERIEIDRVTMVDGVLVGDIQCYFRNMTPEEIVDVALYKLWNEHEKFIESRFSGERKLWKIT